MRATAQQAIDAFRSVDTCTPGLCLTYVVKAWAAPSIGCPDAITSWEWALDRHPDDRDPPPGAPVYYRGGNYGHIAMSLGGGRIRSTDCQDTGRIGDVGLAWPEQAWGYPYLGWAGDLSKQPLPLEGDDMPLTDDDIRRIWQYNEIAQNISGQPKTTNPQTILTRLNPGPSGILSAVADHVWNRFTVANMVTGTSAKMADMIRWIHKESSTAADNTKPT